MPSPLTVQPIGAGLNNQRMALLGLLAMGLEQGVPVALPQATMDFVPVTAGYRAGRIALEDVFDVPAMSTVLQALSLHAESPAGEEVDYHLAFRAGNAIYRAECRARRPVAQSPGLRMLHASRACQPLRDKAGRLADSLGQSTLGLQLRVERDWQRHLKDRAAKHGDISLPGEELVTTPQRIFEKVRATSALDGFDKAFVCCDEADLAESFDELRALAAPFDLKLLFKDDMPEPPEQSRLRQSAVDFELALALPAYVGLTRSTFSNMQALMVGTRSGQFVPAHSSYLYNAAGAVCVRRGDYGMHIEPAKAVSAA